MPADKKFFRLIESVKTHKGDWVFQKTSAFRSNAGAYKDVIHWPEWWKQAPDSMDCGVFCFLAIMYLCDDDVWSHLRRLILGMQEKKGMAPLNYRTNDVRALMATVIIRRWDFVKAGITSRSRSMLIGENEGTWETDIQPDPTLKEQRRGEIPREFLVYNP